MKYYTDCQISYPDMKSDVRQKNFHCSSQSKGGEKVFLYVIIVSTVLLLIFHFIHINIVKYVWLYYKSFTYTSLVCINELCWIGLLFTRHIIIIIIVIILNILKWVYYNKNDNHNNIKLNFIYDKIYTSAL